MLYASGKTTDGKRRFHIFGLTEKNLEKLRTGQPVRFTPESHGRACPADLEVLIMYGADELAIYESLKEAGIHVPTPTHFPADAVDHTKEL